MNQKVIGFIGIECYDLMLYIALTLRRLGCSCVLIDNSEDASLTYVYQGSMQAGDVVDVAGIDIARLVDLAQSSNDQYDYVLVYLGFSEVTTKDYDEFYCVTDFQRHNVERMKEYALDNVCRFLVVRDRTCCTLNPEYLREELANLRITEDAICTIEDTEADVSAKILMHHTSKIRFLRVSASIRSFVERVLEIDFSIKEIDRAFKAAAKG